jgi:hypothetical protein
MPLLDNTPSQVFTPSGDTSLGVRYEGDYNLIALNILTSTVGNVSIKDNLIELSFFEDIHSNFVYGEMLINDAEGLIERLQLHGNEYIRISFGKDGSGVGNIDRLFRIYKASSRRRAQTQDTEKYIIHFCSDELILSHQYKISKSYKNKKISEIITSILVDELKVPSVKYNPNAIEETLGVYNFIVPYLSPFEAINWLSNYAKSKNKDSVGADMLFFENSIGYYFTSLQTLYSLPSYFTYEYNPKNISEKQYGGDIAKKIYNVSGYEILDNFNTEEVTSDGIIANRLLSVDPILRQYDKTDFNYLNYFKGSNHLNNYPILNNLHNRFGDALYETPEACFKLYATNKNQKFIPYINSKPGSIQNDFQVERYITHRRSQLNLSNYHRMKLYVPGDPSMTAGYTINFNLLSGTPATQTVQKNLDQLYSGKYVVSAVRHMIQGTRYNMVMEICKESNVDIIGQVDNSLPIWKNTTKGIIR